MEKLLQDLRFAVRSIVRQPGFALTAIVTLGLGIGATTAIFSVVDAVILRPLPFERADRIVSLRNFWTKTGTPGTQVSAPDFHDWQAQARSFQAIAYYQGGQSSVTIGPRADYASVYVVSPQFFDVLHARAAAGRLPTAQEQQSGGPLAVVITDAFWQRQFARAGAAIGSTLKYSDRVFVIAGVLEPGIRFPARADVYAPAWIFPETTSRSAHNYRAIARLADGVSIEQARAEMTGIATRLASQYPQSNEGKLTDVHTIQDVLVGTTRATLYTLLGAVGLVLLIACANVANLLLSRATAREREMVVRAAVGASRLRLVRQLLTESAVLALLAALLGAWLARVGMLGLLALAPQNLPRLDEVHVDVGALGFAIAIALVASVVFGLAPALQASSVELADGLRTGGKGSAMGARTGWARSAFVIAEVALAMVLVAGAGLLARSLGALSAVDMGFTPERLLLLQTNVPVNSRDAAQRAMTFYRDLLPELAALPGVSGVAGVTGPPTAPASNGGYWIEGGPSYKDTGVRAPQALFNVITPGYFKTMGIRVDRGRDFADGDRHGSAFVAIVNESLARATFPNVDPIGRRIQCGLDSLEFMTIVGVVSDVRSWGPAAPPQAEIFMPYDQHPGPATNMTIVARTSTPDPLALVDTMRRRITARNADVPVKGETMDATLGAATATPRFQTFLLVAFAGVALLLALAGVYGVMAYTVSQRVPELGVRIALGASPRDIRALVIGQGMRLAGAGLVIGLVLALASGRILQGFLFGVTAHDPMILLAVSITVAVATLAACYIPVRRAVRVDPMVALRAE